MKELSELTWIQVEDVESTLSSLNLLKYMKGQHLVNTSQATAKMIEEHFKQKESITKKYQVRFKPLLLIV